MATFETPSFSIAEGNVRLFTDQWVIMLKAIDHNVDPVELTVEEARTLRDALSQLIEQVEEQDGE